MLASVVIITRNEAARLRLTLESLAGQELPPGVQLEVVVVDDGCTDESPAVLAEAQGRLPLRIIRHPRSAGRSPSRNHGVREATGEIVILLDGDCLAAPTLVARHAQVHGENPRAMGRGETYHLRQTRFFLDPETGTPMPGQEEHVRRMGAQLPDALLSREQVRTSFATVAARAEPGIYAGAGPRRLYELEMEALHNIPEATILWMTAPGQNFSLRRADFLAAGGFDERLAMNEHRELAFRLHERGVKMVPVDGARSFHLLHRVGWRDPLDDSDWEQIFYRAHPCLATKLMSIFWLTLARDKDLPEEARIPTLAHLETLVREGSAFDYDALRRHHPRLAPLE
jgi:glycosyltransferase involved in cell wall biosynthesis